MKRLTSKTKNSFFPFYLKITLSFFLFFGLTQLLSVAGQNLKDQVKSKNLTFSQWLVLGPHSYPLPHSLKKLDKVDFGEIFKLEKTSLPQFTPEKGTSFFWPDGSASRWRIISTENNEVILQAQPEAHQVGYLANYIDVKRWVYAELHLASHHPFHVYLDGQPLFSKGLKQVAKKAQMAIPISLTPGKHLLLIKSFALPNEKKKWSISGFLSVQSPYLHPLPELTISPSQRLTIHHLLDRPQVNQLSISPDGEKAALLFRQIKAPSDNYRWWIEIYDLKEKKLIQTISPSSTISQLKWSPQGNRFAYLLQEKGTASLRLHDLSTGEIITPLSSIKNLQTYFWFPDGESILYVISTKEKPDPKGLFRFRHLADRLPEAQQKLSFFRLHLTTLARQPLLLDSPTTSVEGLSPSGDKLLLARTVVKETERPFAQTKLYLLNLTSLECEKIWEGKWFTHAIWSPDARKLLLLGGPSLAGPLGQNVPPGVIPNEYDTQAYLFDLATQKIIPLTKNFDPAINNAFWNAADNNIYLVATEKSYKKLFYLNPTTRKIKPLSLPVEVIEKFSLATNKPVALWIGSSCQNPQKVYVTYLDRQQTNLLCFPGKELFKHVQLGKVENWAFKTKKGQVIEGRIYYPPDFDPNKRYPCLVYYYGGTLPTTREFGGRYPKNLYAAHGYVVYVLQPSGAVGFGQAFSALHVNDWGQIVAEEIITGVKQFLAAHPFVDPSRVGCLGASFGGFMTMTLLTKTNMFAAAVAHAGISLIPSYWGQGYWGYAYSAIATANSYPWNRKDIYVERSPLFNADKITTPLLLLHGSVDTNVPPGESTQLFTALRILGREVEYIQVKGQNHQILAYNQRILWTKTILAWLAKWLKKQPEWWNHLYPSS